MKAVVRSDSGKERLRNEDNYYCKERGEFSVLAVADGMGGHTAGDIASAQAIDTLKEFIETSDTFSSPDALLTLVENTVKKANSNIFYFAAKDPEKMGMGTTLTVGVISGANLYIAHVGDSRAYRFSKDGMERLTRDHSVVEKLVAEGKLSPEEVQMHPQRNVLTRALGTASEVEVDLSRVELSSGEGLLFCTDGLTSHLTEEEIWRIIMEGKMEPETAANQLIDMANNRGGQDNITLILAVDAGGTGI